MKAASVLLSLALGLLIAAPAAGQQLPVKQPVLKAVADSMIPPAPYIATNGKPSTDLRNRLAARLDSLSRVPLKVDTVRIFVPVPVTDTLYCNADGLCDSDGPPPVVPVDTFPPIPFPDEADSVLTGSYVGNVKVPVGETWQLGANVRIAGNLLVDSATLTMRPGGSLAFLGANPDAYLGGGMGYTDAFKNDIGLWVGDGGRLDFACTPKTAWDYAPASDWSATDEIWVTPTAVRDFLPRRWHMGDSIPRASALVPPAELVNTTRDCTVTGPAHIYVHSTLPQRVEYVRLVNMGVSNKASKGPVLGRYALHLHMMGEASRGSSIKGVVSVGARSRVFVIHASHGVTLSDNVCLNSYAECNWWDFGQDTDDITVDRMLACGVQMPDSIGGTQSNVPAISLPSGTGTSMTGSVACGALGGKLATGMDWPEPTTQFDSTLALVWRYEGNVVHNNRGPGIRFWTNRADAHVVTGLQSYHNAGGCVENGAYFSGTEYHGITCVEDGINVGDASANLAAFNQNASATNNAEGRVAQLTDCNVSSLDGPAYEVGHRQLPGDQYQLIQRCTFKAAAGKPLVRVISGDNPWKARFIETNVLPADILIEPGAGNEGTLIEIDPDGDGPLKGWIVSFLNGQKKVTNR